jgi:hypothetical protein
MQLQSTVKRGGINAGKGSVVPEATPVGRTLISTNPGRSAKFFLDYFDANEVQVPACSHQAMKAVEVQAGFGKTFTYTFVQDTSLPRGSLNSETLVSEVREKMEAIFAGKEGLYNAWIDNHDGFNQSSFNYKKALEEGVQIGIFDWTATNEVFGIVRFLIPETLFTFELVAPKAFLDEFKLPELISSDCRDDTLVPPPDETFGATVAWFKTTMMAAQPYHAGVWASEILGMEDYPAPFPWPPVEGCTAAVWKVFAGSSYMLHFVLSSGFQSSSALGTGETGLVQKFVDEVYSFRKLAAGEFDHFMLNNLVLQVDSLDPYIEKLRARGYPFMLTRVGEEYALFTDVPHNAQIVQLRSSHVSTAEAKVVEGVCLV